MQRFRPVAQEGLRNDAGNTDIQKGKLDLVVLRYMARRLHLTVRQLDEPVPASQPLLYRLQERYGRMHRIAIYKQQELVLRDTLMFVGFISRKRKALQDSIADQIEDIDRQLLVELVNAPGIVSYSSLELRNGDWCNLVLLSDVEAKMHIRDTPIHRYAAYRLSEAYYEWIRLHHGIMPEGLDHTEMLLQKTRYYFFSAPQTRPTIWERIYDSVGIAPGGDPEQLKWTGTSRSPYRMSV
ncbi:MAG TPA: hypothetical protein VFA09_27230 [Ktedonobacteraceae bacterium]|nr:hypothetical protein [Ktedonobacteraceae bacterium]